MRSRMLLSIVFALTASAAFADEPKKIEPGPWKYTTVLGANLSQSTFSTNWSGGDKGSIVWVLNANAAAERQFNMRFNELTTLQVAYGQTTQQVDANGKRVWDSPDKTTDQIVAETVGRWTLDSWADPFVSIKGESQFSDESNPLGKLTFNPIKLKETAGLARVLHKTADAEAITRLGFGFRQALGRTLVAGTPVETKHFSTNDGGVEWATSVKQPILQKKILWTGSLVVFQPVFFSASSALDQFDKDAKAADPAHQDVAGFWRTTDVNAQSTFTAQITKSIGVQLFTQWVYDKFDNAANIDTAAPLPSRIAEVQRSIRKAGQFKETLALALTYRLL